MLQTKVKEKPILFSGEMVRAILDGRKTQTRRVIKPQPSGAIEDVYRKPDGRFEWLHLPRGQGVGMGTFWCPYGVPGNQLWVRETWRPWSWHEGEPISVEYKADGSHKEAGTSEDEIRYEEWDERIRISASDECTALNLPRNENEEYHWAGDNPLKCRPSIHMPRWASRIDLLIKDIRVERVQDISVDDALKELSTHSTMACPRMEFAQLWNEINAKRGFGWDVNPWVWVIEFEKV